MPSTANCSLGCGDNTGAISPFAGGLTGHTNDGNNTKTDERRTMTSDHHERVHQVIRVLHAGATEMAWSTRYDVDDGLTWDAKREVWVGSDGFAYDGERLRSYSRGGS